MCNRWRSFLAELPIHLHPSSLWTIEMRRHLSNIKLIKRIRKGTWMRLIGQQLAHLSREPSLGSSKHLTIEKTSSPAQPLSHHHAGYPPQQTHSLLSSAWPYPFSQQCQLWQRHRLISSRSTESSNRSYSPCQRCNSSFQIGATQVQAVTPRQCRLTVWLQLRLRFREVKRRKSNSRRRCYGQWITMSQNRRPSVRPPQILSLQ